MAGRSEHTAVKAYVAPIQRAVSCFVQGVVRPSAYKDEDGLGVLVLNDDHPAPLTGDVDLALQVRQQYEIVHVGDSRLGPYKVSTRAYQYSFVRASNENDELYAYHWHPESQHRLPHLHAQPEERRHLPTGRVAIEEMLLLAHELGAEPLRDNWRHVILDALSRFRQYRTWHHTPGASGRG